MARNIHYHPERKERVPSEEVLYQSKIKANVKALFRTPTPPSAVDGNMLLSLGLVPSPACGSPWQVHHSSGVPNALRSPVQSRGHLHTTASPGVHAGPPLASEANSTPIFCILYSKVRTTWPKLSSSSADWGWNLNPSLNCIYISFASLMGFLCCVSFPLIPSHLLEAYPGVILP